MPEIILTDKSGHPVLTVADDGFSVSCLGRTVPMLAGYGRLENQAAAIASLARVDVPHSADQSYEIGGNVLVRTATTHAFTMACAYTDTQGNARVLTLTFGLLAGGVTTTSIANANGTVPYHGVPVRIRAKKGTSVIVSTTGTFTTVAYDAEASIGLAGS